MRLRDNWTVVQKYSHKIDIVVVILVFIAFVWFVKTHLARRK
jgi:hypothetical protein